MTLSRSLRAKIPGERAEPALAAAADGAAERAVQLEIERLRARIVRWVLLLGGLALGLGYWWLTFDGCSFGFGCW